MNGDVAAEQHESEDVSIFGSGSKEELVGVSAIGDGAAQPGKPVEDDRWLFGVEEEQLADDVGGDVGHAEGERAGQQGESGGHAGRRGGDLAGREAHVVKE